MTQPDDKRADFQDEVRDALQDKSLLEQVYERARAIPVGRVLSYSALGARCEPPVSGYICGRIMNNVAEGVPWWRVVAKDGRLPVSKRSPNLGQEQRKRLEDEGVEFDEEGRVQMDRFSDDLNTGPTLF